LLLADYREADAETIHRPQRHHAHARIARLLDHPGIQRIGVAEAAIAIALLQRLVEQSGKVITSVPTWFKDSRRVAGLPAESTEPSETSPSAATSQVVRARGSICI
jgi:hypothetical protein